MRQGIRFGHIRISVAWPSIYYLSPLVLPTPSPTFSGGRRTLSWNRERMSCVNLEKVECIGNWLREGLIIPSSRGGRGLVVDGEINGSIRVDSDDDLD